MIKLYMHFKILKILLSTVQWIRRSILKHRWYYYNVQNHSDLVKFVEGLSAAFSAVLVLSFKPCLCCWKKANTVILLRQPIFSLFGCIWFREGIDCGLWALTYITLDFFILPTDRGYNCGFRWLCHLSYYMRGERVRIRVSAPNPRPLNSDAHIAQIPSSGTRGGLRQEWYSTQKLGRIRSDDPGWDKPKGERQLFLHQQILASERCSSIYYIPLA